MDTAWEAAKAMWSLRFGAVIWRWWMWMPKRLGRENTAMTRTEALDG